MPSAERPMCNPSSFWEEARYQRVCAVCEKGGQFHAHHVVDKQTLKRYGRTKNALYDTRNALRLCSVLAPGRNCHMQFENSRIRVTTAMLTDDNIEYAFEVMGLYAADWLRGEYDDSARDPRITELEMAAA